MGRFDEQATYEKEKAAEAGGVGGGTAPTAQMSDMSVNEQPVRGRPRGPCNKCRLPAWKVMLWRCAALAACCCYSCEWSLPLANQVVRHTSEHSGLSANHSL